MKPTLFFAIILVFSGVLSSCTTDKIPPLIDREVFFDDPEISGIQISPDGSYISFIKPYKGTRNIWIKTIDEAFEDAIPISKDSLRPISGCMWTRDGRFILYAQDKGGDENFNIYAINPAEASPGVIPEARNLTNLKDIRVMIYHIPRNNHDLLYLGINDRDKAWHDLYSLQISTGKLTLIRENTNRYTSWIFDNDANLRLATLSRMDGSSELWRIDEKGETLLYGWSIFETAYPSSFKKDNKHLYIVSNVGDDVDLTQLYQMDIETGNMELVEADPEGKVDFGGMVISDKTLDVLYTAYTDGFTRRYYKDKDFEEHIKGIEAQFPNDEVSMYGATTDEKLWLVNVWADINPGETYIYNMETKELVFQNKLRPNLNQESLSTVKSINYKSSDGLEIQAYLTLPKGTNGKNLPLVVNPHGGPWARDYWGYNPYGQFLANRGYAVLQPNFRASTGFGKDFLNAGNKQWGDLMQDDITWGVKHLIEQGIVDENRVAIFGGSYGGYATLAGLAFTPDLYTCGVSLVGPSNLITLINSLPPYWEAGRKTFYERMGDPNTEEGLEQIKRQSPLFSADKIVAPLMVVQGQNDPRVKKAESDQIVIALRDRGFAVEYLNAPDEGHGYARPVNNMAFIAAMEKFLAKHLNGRYQESITDEVAKRLEDITVDVNTVEFTEGQ
ncbi:MAG: S9 family peptidase [Bacteroidales bacterium]|nr:S9 family peptidase [Bacteroidales bacterium]MDD3892349.1 S9 family peptidase [Bacteroidales bacterium]